MSVVTEVLDRLPNPDGGLRRRFTSGILFVLIALVGIFWIPGIPAASQSLRDVFGAMGVSWAQLNSTGTLVILFSIIFVVGNLIEVFAYVFLNRLFFLAGGTIAYRGVQASYKRIRGEDEEALNLSAREQASYEELPRFVREGLSNPYHRQFEVAFRYLIHKAPDDEKGWLLRIDSRNQNLFSVISTVFVAMFLVLVLSVVPFVNGGPGTLQRAESLLSDRNSRDCYLDVVAYSHKSGLIDRPSAVELQQRVNAQDPQVVADIAKLLSAETDVPDANSDDVADMVRLFGQCGNRAPESEPVVDTTVNALLSAARVFGGTLLFLVPLAVIYALMLRYSITSALEMLWLRRGIVGRDGDNDDHPGADTSAASETTFDKRKRKR